MTLNSKIIIAIVFAAAIAVSAATRIALAAEYMIFDLESSEVETLDAAPEDLTTNDAYKTTKMVFRRIPAGAVSMGGGRLEVTQTRDFYMAVFQCTQAQWELIVGDNPSRYRGAHRPVERVSYGGRRAAQTMVRGGEWPDGDPDDDSFMGKLRAKFNDQYRFDLPTEAQWEYAARAGTYTALNSGEDLSGDVTCDNLANLGRYYFNRNDGRGEEEYTTHTSVGSYEPNAWGIYDMHGNVWEWCRDWWWQLPAGEEEDYAGHTGQVSGRVLRGGAWSNYAWFCHYESRDDGNHIHMYSSIVGFRVVIEME